MKILSFDTSTNTLRAGLQTDSGWYENIRSAGLKHGESLIPMISAILDEAGIKPSELDLVVCTKGPGSFTGLRIGLSTGKGISEGAGVPLVSVSTLQVYGSLYSFFPGIVVPVLDAKKRQFYTSFYRNGEPVLDEMDIPAEDILAHCKGKGMILFTGPGLDVFLERIPGIADNDNFYIDTFAKNSFCNILSILGEQKYRKAGADPPESGPAYLRASDAELGR